MDQFIWKTRPELDTEELGSERAKQWLPSKWANLKPRKGGLGTLDLRCGRSFWGVPGGTGGTPHLGLKSHSKCLHLAGWAKPTQLRR